MARDGDFELVTLNNGARSVRHVVNGEVMHPSVGPWPEARSLYVEQSRLSEKLQIPGPALELWDIGLGAGTNAVAALTCAKGLGARQRRQLKIVSFEVDLAPLRLALADTQGFPFLQPFADAAQALLLRQQWSQGLLVWDLRLGDALSHWRVAPDPARAADVIFFDPFSPAANPNLWTPAAFEQLRGHCRDTGDGCTLFTYSAATPTRVSLLLGGFFVGAGIATGMKVETTAAATRRELLLQPLHSRWLERWQRSSSPAPHGSAMDAEIERKVRGHAQWRAKA
jgi:tRNA U34 5-methylaminomethyl-2-thiouridine-forming methyltransferase MnmC